MAQKYANIRRDSTITEGHPDWTEGKAQAAQIIQEKIDQGEWPVSLEQLADDTEWSRSHYRNTIRDLFVIAEEQHEQDKPEATYRNNQIDIPDDVESVSDYLRGYANGINHARQEE